jgi:hypothetical protein
MGMFNWQAGPGDVVVTHRFWIYWAVTGPLTLIVFTIWLTWLYTHKEREAFPFEARLASLSKMASSPLVDKPTESSWSLSISKYVRSVMATKDKHAEDEEADKHEEEEVGMSTATEQIVTGKAKVQKVNTVIQGPRR